MRRGVIAILVLAAVTLGSLAWVMGARVDALERRVSELESRLGEAQSRLSSLERGLHSLGRRAGEVEAACRHLGLAASSLEANVTRLGNEVSRLAGDVQRLSGTVTSLGAGIAEARKGCLKYPVPWVYWLQGANLSTIVEAGFRLAVVDYSRDGGDETAYSREEVLAARRAGVVLLAYLSVGEAEDYRFYWKEEWRSNPPSWLGRENPEWPGNYKVRYWEPGWRSILASYLDRILSAGFSGVYLDVVDAYEYWSDPGNGEGFVLDEGVTARLMVDLVEWVANYTRLRSPGFLVFIQNGEGLAAHDPRILGIVDGIGVEDLWYDETRPQPRAYVAERLKYLSLFLRTGKTVLVVDYVDDGTGYSEGGNISRIRDFVLRALLSGMNPYVASVDRMLDRPIIIPGIQPSGTSPEGP